MQGRLIEAQPALDLTNCDREPIHIPGAVQPHGVLLAVDERTGRIVQASENVGAVLGRDTAAVLHDRLEAAVGRGAASRIAQALRDAKGATGSIFVEIAVDGEPTGFDAIVHARGGVQIVELEPAQPSSSAELEHFFSIVRAAVEQLQRAADVDELCDRLAEQFAIVAGFDRTMVYRFDRDWNGEVIAERRDPSLPPFLGLHYPASDIPRQARELYRRSVLRLIPDASYSPARLVPPNNPLSEAPLDLSDSVLRSVSPVHLQYLANMGVVASCSASLLKHGELWGLVALHHRTPRRLPYRVRVACEMLARTAGLGITALEDRGEFAYRMRLRALQPSLLAAVAKDGSFEETVSSKALLDIADADGAAIKTEGEPLLTGVTPRLRDVRRLLRWLDDRSGTDPAEPFVTDALSLMNPDFADLKDMASGVLAVPLTTTKGGWIVWFRPEQERSVVWSGRPEKPRDGETLTPRTSFDAWRETVRERSRPWEQAHVDAAVELRRLLSDVMMRRTREFARLNAELARSNAELESFAYVASHDLKEPLRGLAHYAAFLISDHAESLDERGREMLTSMRALTMRMEQQIESMLDLARVTADTPSTRVTDLDLALDEALALLAGRIAEMQVEIVRPERLGTGVIAPARAREVFVNLIGNAIKYNDRDRKRVEIFVADATPPRRATGPTSLPAAGSMRTLAVRDNGIGIRERHLETVFAMFKRLHAQEHFGGGSGAGLAIARKIVEQNGGLMWVESVVGEGSTFYFTVPEAER